MLFFFYLESPPLRSSRKKLSFAFLEIRRLFLPLDFFNLATNRSIREDFMTSQNFRTAEEKDNYYAELKTAAESGWDFSSRWFVLEGTNKGNYCHFSIISRAIEPLCLYFSCVAERDVEQNKRITARVLRARMRRLRLSDKTTLS